jgi:hypothetical protein
MKRLGIATFVALSGLVCACATADDDSWAGVAGELSDGGDGGSGGAPGTTSGSTTGTATVTSTSHGATTTGVTTGSTTSAVTTGGGGCDTGSCDTCQQCAMNGGPCSDEIDACFANVDCSAFLDCLSACGDDVCMNACVDAHPNGLPLYDAVGTCVFCDACPLTCAAC